MRYQRAILIIAFCLVYGNGSICAESNPSAVDEAIFTRYMTLNDAEIRLEQYKDSPDVLRLKLAMLSIINSSRQQYKAAPVELDILACRVANQQSAEAAANGFSGHWNLRGEKPYHRYAFAGGVDHVSENASSLWSSAVLDPAETFNYMRNAHAAFMAERSPNDGHKRNVIDQAHTHVGLGVAMIGKQFRYYEEYVDRYVVLTNPPQRAAAGETVMLPITPRSGYFVYAVLAYYEAFLKPMNVAQLNAKGSYPDYSNETAFTLWPYQIELKDDGSCTVPLKFAKPGLYYLMIYLDTKKPARSGSFGTSGKIQASGVVVRVE